MALKNKADVVIVSPGNHSDIYQSLASRVAAIEPPVWAGMLAKFLRNERYNVVLFDQVAQNLTNASIAQEVRTIGPKLVIIVVYGHQPSASTQCMTAAIEISRYLKVDSPEQQVILVGGHPSALPKQSLTESNADFVCQGEGPYTIHALLELDDFYNENQLRKVPGLWFKHENQIHFSYSAPLISEDNLPKTLPGIAWDLLPMKNYRAHNWHCFNDIQNRSPYAAIYTSLGCPYRCTFCCINAPFGKSGLRCWDSNFIIEEIETLVTRFNIKNLKIVDEMFVLKEKHVGDICDKIIDRGLRLNIWAYARVDSIKPALLEKMKRAGFNWLCLGIESSSKHVRQGVQKGKFQMEDIYRVTKQIQDSGIYVLGNYIFGLPDDDWISMSSTLDLAKDLNLEFANFYAAMAYPGSQLYDLAIKNSWKLPERWQDFSQHSYKTLPLPTECLSASEVLAFRDYAWNSYFTSFKYLRMIEEKFGPGVRQHIQELSKFVLLRKYSSRLEPNLPVNV